MLKDLVKIENIVLDLNSTTKDEVIDEMVLTLDNNGYIKNSKKFKKDIYKRESLGNTGLGFGIAIPHAKSKYVNECSICVGISKNGIEYDSLDGNPVNLVFMLAIDGKENDLHLKALAEISRKLINDEFRENLLNSKTKEDIYNLLTN